MVAVDYWPQEEGYIVEGAPVIMCYAAAAVGEMSCVKLSATTAGRVDVAASAAEGDSLGIALRATAGATHIPVAFGGIVKLTADAAIALGQGVMSKGDDTDHVVTVGDSTAIMLGDNGTKRVLGTTLQEGTVADDEILVILGRW